MEKEKTRNSNIELLRLFALYGVLILHYMHNGEGCGYAIDPAVANGIDTPFFRILRALFMQSTDLFVIITGYCSYKSKETTWKKPLLLILTLISSRLVHYAINLLLGSAACSFADLILTLTPADYFVILYCVLYVFTPYINRFLETLTDRALLRFIVLAFLIFSVWSFVIDALAAPTDSLWWRFMNPVGPISTQHGYTILNFFLLYVPGAYCSRSQVSGKLRPGVRLLIYLAGFRIQSVRINRLAKPVFFIYTFHWSTFSLLFIEQVMQTGNHLLIVVHGLLVPVAVYLICIPAYFLYRLYMRPLLKGR